MKPTATNLIPNRVNQSPDYYCTWQTQLYATCDGKPAAQRRCLSESALFDTEKPFGWADFYPQARRDLLFVMDDSWDVPPDGDPAFFGSLRLDSQKFPDSTADNRGNVAALKHLADRIKSMGWKGLGGWVCLQESVNGGSVSNPEAYWIAKLQEANDAGFAYWKVDWGDRCCDADLRISLSRLGRRYAPQLTVEHAMMPSVIPYSDVFRTYDVPAIMSISMTMIKLAELLPQIVPQQEGLGLINCEDEAYLAAAGGFTMGIMRHPYVGSFTNGHPDPSFPALHRNLKTKMYEVLRATRWHRVAPAFGGGTWKVSSATLSDTWRFQAVENEIEDWWLSNASMQACLRDGVLTKNAPAAIARNADLPQIEPDTAGDFPYCVASKNPNGVFSVVTLGRTQERQYAIPRCHVTVNTDNAHTIGIFGEYQSLTLQNVPPFCTAQMQDMAGETAWDVTDQLQRNADCLRIPGELIHTLGTLTQPNDDTSEPGVVLHLSL